MNKHQFIEVAGLINEKQRNLLEASFDEVDWECFFYYSDFLSKLFDGEDFNKAPYHPEKHLEHKR